MSLEKALHKSLKEAKYFSIFCWGFFIILFPLLNAFPRIMETFDFMAIAFAFGIALGSTAVWDTVRGNVKKELQTSEKTQEAET